MKKLIGYFTIFIGFSTVSFGQECDSLVNICYKHLTADSKVGKTFISEGQVYKAFVDAEQSAEFKFTFYAFDLNRPDKTILKIF